MNLESLVLELYADTSRLDREVKAAVSRAANQIKKLEQSNLAVKVNEKPLHDLNKLLDVKQAHVRQTAAVFKDSPLELGIDDSQLVSAQENIQSLKSELSSVSGKPVDVRVSQEITGSLRDANKGLSGEIRNLGKGLKDIVSAVKASQKMGLGDILSGTVGALLGSPIAIARGALEGIGRDITEEIAKGFKDELNKGLSNKFGSPKAIGIVAGKGLVGQLQNSIDSIDGWIDAQIDAEIKSQGKKKKKSKKRESLEFIRGIFDDVSSFVDGYVPTELREEEGRVSAYEREKSKAKTKAKSQKGVKVQAESQSRVLTAFESVSAIEKEFSKPLNDAKVALAVNKQKTAMAEMRLVELDSLIESAQKSGDTKSLSILNKEYESIQKDLESLFNQSSSMSAPVEKLVKERDSRVASVLSGLQDDERAKVSSMLIASQGQGELLGQKSQAESLMRFYEGKKGENAKRYDSPNTDIQLMAAGVDEYIDSMILQLEKTIAGINQKIEKSQSVIESQYKKYASSQLEITSFDEGLDIENARDVYSVSQKREQAIKGLVAGLKSQYDSLRSEYAKTEKEIESLKLQRSGLAKKIGAIDNDFWLNDDEKESRKAPIMAEMDFIGSQIASKQFSADRVNPEIQSISDQLSFLQKSLESEKLIQSKSREKIKRNSLTEKNLLSIVSGISGSDVNSLTPPELVNGESILPANQLGGYNPLTNTLTLRQSAIDLLASVDLNSRENAEVLQILAHELAHYSDIGMGSREGLGAYFSGNPVGGMPSITVGDYLGKEMGQFIAPYKDRQNFQQVRGLELSAQSKSLDYIESKFDDINFDSPIPTLAGVLSKSTDDLQSLMDVLMSQPKGLIPVTVKAGQERNVSEDGIVPFNESVAKTNNRLKNSNRVEYESVSIVQDLIEKVETLSEVRDRLESRLSQLAQLENQDISNFSQDQLDNIEKNVNQTVKDLRYVQAKIQEVTAQSVQRIKSYQGYTQGTDDIQRLLDDALNFNDLQKLQEAKKRISAQIKAIKADSSLDDRTKAVLVGQAKEVAAKAKVDTKLWDNPDLGDFVRTPIASTQLVLDKTVANVTDTFASVGDAIVEAGERIKGAIEYVQTYPLESLQIAGKGVLAVGGGMVGAANKGFRTIAPAISTAYGLAQGAEDVALDLLPYGRLAKKGLQAAAVVGGLPLAAATVPALAPVGGILAGAGHLGGALAGGAAAGQLGAISSIPIIGGQVAGLLTTAATGLGTIVGEMAAAAITINAVGQVAKAAIQPETKQAFAALEPSREQAKKSASKKTSNIIEKAQNLDKILPTLPENQRAAIAEYLPKAAKLEQANQGDFIPQSVGIPGLKALTPADYQALDPVLQNTIKDDLINQYKSIQKVLFEFSAKIRGAVPSLERTMGEIPNITRSFNAQIKRFETQGQKLGIDLTPYKMPDEAFKGVTLDATAQELPDLTKIARDASVSMESVGTAQAEGIGEAFTAKMPEVVENQVTEVAKGKKAIKKDNGIASPAKVWEDEIGKPLGQGVEVGAVKAIQKAGVNIENEVRKITGHGILGNAFLAVGYDIVESLMNGMDGFKGGIDKKLAFLETYVKSAFEVIYDLPKVTGTPETFAQGARKLIQDIGGQGYATPEQLESAKGLFPKVVANYSSQGGAFMRGEKTIFANPSNSKEELTEVFIHEYTHFLQTALSKSLESESVVARTSKKANAKYVLDGAKTSSESLVRQMRESMERDGVTLPDSELKRVKDYSMGIELEAYANGQALTEAIKKRNFFRVDAGHVAKVLKTGQGYAPMFNPPTVAPIKEEVKVPEVQPDLDSDLSIQDLRLSLLRTIKKLTKDFPDFADNLMDLYGNIRGDLESLFEQTDSLNTPKGQFKFNVPTDDLNKKLYQLLYSSLPESYLAKSQKAGIDPSKFIESGGVVSFDKIPSNLTDSLASAVSNELPELQTTGELIGESLDAGTRKSLEMNSPSKLYIRHGKNTIISFEMGVEGELKRIKDTEIPVPELENQGYIDLAGLAESVGQMKEYKEIYDAVMDSWSTNLDIDNPESTAKVGDTAEPLIQEVEKIQKAKAKHAQAMAKMPPLLPVVQSIDPNEQTRIFVPNVPDAKRGQWLKPNIYNNTDATSYVSQRVNEDNWLESANIDDKTKGLIKRLREKSVTIDKALASVAFDAWNTINQAVINSQNASLEETQSIIDKSIETLNKALQAIDSVDIDEGTLLANSEAKIEQLVSLYEKDNIAIPEIGVTAGNAPFSVNVPKLTPELLKEYDDAIAESRKQATPSGSNDIDQLLARVEQRIKTLDNNIDVLDQASVLMDDGYEYKQALGIASGGTPPVPPIPPNIFGTLRQQFPIIDQAISKVEGLRDTITKFGMGALKLIGLAVLTKSLVDLGVEAVNVYRRFEGIFIASRMVGNGAQYLEKVREQTKALGGDLESTMRSAIQFSSALVGTNLESTGQQLFLDSDKALKSLGLQTQEYDNAMRAIIQISSKGKVSMEELSGQLGEQVPGALQIAADAMQTNVKGLIQMVSSGNLLAEDFVPKFVQQLKNRTAFLAPAVENSLNASIGRLGAQREDLFVNIGAEISPAIIPIVNTLSGALKVLTDNFDALVFGVKSLALYLASPALIGAIKAIPVVATAAFGNLMKVMTGVKLSASTMWAAVMGPLKIASVIGLTAGFEALFYVLSGGNKSISDITKEMDQFRKSLSDANDEADRLTGFESIKNFVWTYTLKPFDLNQAKKDLEDALNKGESTLDVTTANINPSGIDEYLQKAGSLQSTIDEMISEKDALLIADPVKNKQAIDAIDQALYGDNGLVTKMQKETGDAFVLGGRAGIEEQMRIAKAYIDFLKNDSTMDELDTKYLSRFQAMYDRAKVELTQFDVAQERLSNGLNRQRKAWIELTSSIVGYEDKLSRALLQQERGLYKFFNDFNVGTEVQSVLVAEFDVTRQQAEVEKYQAYMKANREFLEKSLTIKDKSFAEQVGKKPLMEIDAEAVDRIERSLQNASDTTKSAFTDQVMERLKAMVSDSMALEQAYLELEKGKNSLRQAKISEQEYVITTSRSILDFNRNLGVQLLNIQNQFRDYNRQLEDASINSAKMVRGLVESYNDLNWELENNILTVQNELADAQDRLALTNLKIQQEQFDPGQDTIGKRAGSIILKLFESINSGESEKRRRLQEANQAQKEYTDTLRRVRDFEEQVLQERINQKRTLEDLTTGFQNLNQAVKDLVLQLNQSREDLIRNTKNQSGRDISGQLAAVPSVAQMGVILPPPPPPISQAIIPASVAAIPQQASQPTYSAPTRPNSSEPSYIRYGAAVVPQQRQSSPPRDLYELTNKYGGNSQDFIPSITQPSPQIQSVVPQPKPQLARTQIAPVSVNVNIPNSQQEYFAKLIVAESGGESLLGQALTARSVLNRQRVNNPRAYMARSNSLTDLINAPNQYQPVSTGAINKPRTPQQMAKANQAINLASNDTWLKSELEKLGYTQGQIKQLLNATGFRTPSAFNDPSQNHNRVRFGGHIFNSDKVGKQRLQSSLGESETLLASGLSDMIQPILMAQSSTRHLEGSGKPNPVESLVFDGIFGENFVNGLTMMSDFLKGITKTGKTTMEGSGAYNKQELQPYTKPEPDPVLPTVIPTKEYPTNIPPATIPNIRDVRVAPPAPIKFTPNPFEFINTKLAPLPQLKDAADIPAPNLNQVLTQIPDFNTATLNDKTAQLKSLRDAFNQVNLQIISAEQKLNELTAISEMRSLVQQTEDSIRQMNFNLISSADTVRRMQSESKGYLTISEEIQNVGLDVARNYDSEINSRKESALTLRREVGDSEELLEVYRQQLAQKSGISQETRDYLTAQTFVLQENIKEKTTQAETLELESQQLSYIRNQAVSQRLAREETQRQYEALKEVSAMQLSLANARYDMGGDLFNVGAIKDARTQAKIAARDVQLWAERNQGTIDPKVIQDQIAMQKELSDINISKSYLDAIPPLRDFTSGLKDIILMTSNWQEVTKKLIDTLAGLVLDQLVIKPMQNWLAQGIAGVMGWMGNATAPTDVDIPLRKPIEDNASIYVDLNSKLLIFGDRIDNLNQKLGYQVSESVTSTNGGVSGIVNTGLGLVSSGLGMFGNSAGFTPSNIVGVSDTVKLPPFTLAMGTDNLDSTKVPNFAFGDDNIEVLTLAIGNDGLGIEPVKVPSFAMGNDDIEIPNFANGLLEGINKAFVKEKAQSGKQPYLAVLHKGEAVLSTLNGDAQLLRSLKASGQWNHLKANPSVANYAYGSEFKSSRIDRNSTANNQTTIYKPEYKIYAQDADSFRKSQSQIEMDSIARMRRAKR